jgi:co-chaperonin GroES (HSP10)
MNLGLNDFATTPEDMLAEMGKDPTGKPKDMDEELGVDFSLVKPLYDYVLITYEKPAEEKADAAIAEKRTAGGIIIPDRDLQGKQVRKAVEKKYLIAEVVATGVGNYDMNGKEQPWPFKIGDRVMVPRHGGLNMLSRKDLKLYRVIRAKEIIMVLGEQDKTSGEITTEE